LKQFSSVKCSNVHLTREGRGCGALDCGSHRHLRNGVVTRARIDVYSLPHLVPARHRGNRPVQPRQASVTASRHAPSRNGKQPDPIISFHIKSYIARQRDPDINLPYFPTAWFRTTRSCFVSAFTNSRERNRILDNIEWPLVSFDKSRVY
jgi:hypothetical protein